MSYCWLLLTDSPPTSLSAEPLAAAGLCTLTGEPVGYLTALPHDADVPDSAVKADSRAIDPAGPPGIVSLVWATAGTYLLYDDVAVTEAIRRALAGVPLDVVTTLSQSDDRFLGALTAVHGDDVDRARTALADDPFAVLFPQRLVRVEAGLLGATPASVGPSIQRYGAGSPWPWDRFAAAPPG